jgi:hypothetical protein
MFPFITVCFFSFRMEVQSLLASGPEIRALSLFSERGLLRK